MAGGQRARIGLARSIYSAAVTAECATFKTAADVHATRLVALGSRALYLIDDPFCSLDAMTTKWIWKHVFAPGGKALKIQTPQALCCWRPQCEGQYLMHGYFSLGVLDGKTVLLAANHVADSILQSSCISGVIVVDGGRVTQYSSYAEARKRRDMVCSLSSQSSDFSQCLLVGDCKPEPVLQTLHESTHHHET